MLQGKLSKFEAFISPGVRHLSLLLIVVILFVLIVAVGFRPLTVGTDTQPYTLVYQDVCSHLLQIVHYEYFYQLVSLFFANAAASPQLFFSGIALIDCICIFCLAQKLEFLFRQRIQSSHLFLLLGVFLLISPIFYALMVNVIRQGTAAFALMNFFMILVLRTNVLMLIPWAIVAVGFHRTSILFLAFLPLIFLNYRTVFVLILMGCAIYLLGLSAPMLQLISKLVHVDVYSIFRDYGSKSHYHGRIRLDFALFTLGVGVVFHYLGQFFLAAAERPLFLQVLKIYWILVLPFFIFGFGPFSERYLLAGWCFSSVLAAIFSGYFLEKKQLPIYWFCGGFMVAASFFFLRVQGHLT